MLGFLFGFNARLGRLHYFLAGLALAGMMTLVCFAIAAYAFQHTPRGATPSANLLLIPALCVTPLFLWITFTLQAMRIRDIGWNPAIVIVGWVLVLVLDAVVTSMIPAWSAGKGHHQTVVGVLTNLILTGVLLFWPSGPETGSLSGLDEPPRRGDNAPDAPRPMPALAVARPMRGTMRTEFGQRSV